jgi:hypothetical protein
MKLINKLGNVEKRQLAYAKFLVSEGKKYLGYSTFDYYFNISIILFANSLEICLRTLAYCYDELKPKWQENTAHQLLERLGKKLKGLPSSEIEKVFSARNEVYHAASMKSLSTCRDIEEITERSTRSLLEHYLKLKYDSISLVDFVSDHSVKGPLRKAEQYMKEGNFLESVISSCEAFAIFECRVKKRSRYQIFDGRSDLFRNTKISWAKELKKFFSKIQSPMALIPFSNHIEEQVNKKIINLARSVDFLLMLGSAFEDYKHFLSIRPAYFVFVDGQFECVRETAVKMNYQKDQAEFIFNFVLRTLLDVEPKLRTIEVRSLSKDVIQRVE